MNGSLRIAMFAGCFPAVSETFILRQITGLLDLGHTVHVYADTCPDSQTPLHPEVHGYRLLDRTTFMDMPIESAPWEIPAWPITGRTWVPGATTSVSNLSRIVRASPKLLRGLIGAPRLAIRALRSAEYGYQAASLSMLYRLAKLLSRSGCYDVLHAHFGPVGNSFRFARELWHAPLVVSFHGYDFSTLPRTQGADMYHQLFATADILTVNSEYTRLQVERLGCPSAKIRKLPVGLDLNEFAFRERKLHAGECVRLLTVARLVKIKGHEQVIRALPAIRQACPGVCYDIVGDGPLRSFITQLADRLGVGAAVKIHGALGGDAVRRLLEQSHVFVLASVNVEGDCEGQGLALQEAQACGLPVVATRHGALPEGILDGRTGFLVPEGDPSALAERLIFLLRHPETWPELGRTGRTFVEAHYDIRKLNRRLVDLYAEAMHTFRGARDRASAHPAS